MMAATTMMRMGRNTGVDGRIAPPPLTLLVEEEDDYFLPTDDQDVSSESSPARMIMMRMDALSLLAVEDLESIQEDSTPANHNLLWETMTEKNPSHSDTDAAVAILEEIFFGGSLDKSASSKEQQQQQQQQKDRQILTSSSSSSSTSNVNLDASPRSTIIPACSCATAERRHHIFSSEGGLLHKAQSLPVMMRADHLSSSTSNATSPIQQQQQQLPKRPSLKRRNSCASSSSSSLNSSKRNVSFTDISVREYNVELSDHPSCSFGPPIQLGWSFEEKKVVPVEQYEVTRSPRRQVHELVLSYNVRKRRLKQSGYKKEDLQAAEQTADRIKRERMITEFFLPAMALDEIFEKIFCVLKQTFLQRPSSLPQRSDREQGASGCQLHTY